MNALRPMIWSSASATSISERPKGFSRCFHRKNSAVRRPSGPAPNAERSKLSTASSSVASNGRIAYGIVLVEATAGPPSEGTDDVPDLASRSALEFFGVLECHGQSRHVAEQLVERQEDGA